jgi:hypothetical protein
MCIVVMNVEGSAANPETTCNAVVISAVNKFRVCLY